MYLLAQNNKERLVNYTQHKKKKTPKLTQNLSVCDGLFFCKSGQPKYYNKHYYHK